MLTAHLLGGLRVAIDGSPIPAIAGPRPRSLLAFLLMHPEPHPRGRLAGRFWPDVLDTSARASLRSALWTIREALSAVGGGDYLEASRSHVGIHPRLPRDIDVERFGGLLASGSPADLEHAVALAGQPLLPDLADEWVIEAQDQHAERLVEAITRLASIAETTGDAAAAVRWTRAAVPHDRLSESLHRDLMRRLDATGDRAQALAVYGRLRESLAAELGVLPSESTRDLARSLRGEGGGRSSAARPVAKSAPGGPPIVGRAAELVVLRTAWDQAVRGEGGVVSLAGPPGIGKTRLLREAARWVGEDGGRAAFGAALDLEGAPPLSPWLEAFSELLRVTDAPAEPGWPSDLARLCPSVESLWGCAPREAVALPELERARLFEAAVEMVAWSAREGPVLIGLEDLHGLDAASGALLGLLGRRLSGVRALVIVTRRPAPRSPHLDAALAAIRERALLRAEIVLGPLADEETTALVAAISPDLGAALTRSVVASADGVPLIAREAARAAASGALPAEGLRGTVRVPLGRLEPDARALAAAVAAAGRPLEPGEVADLMGARSVSEAVEACVASGLLSMSADGRIAFRHALIRQAASAELEPAERAQAHRGLAAVLAGRPGRRAAEVARHHRLAGDADAAQRFFVEAAQGARAVGALDEAAAYLDEATGLAPAEAEIWLMLAEVHSWRADRPEMDRAFESAERILIQAGDERQLAFAYGQRGRWLHTTLCYPAEALATSRRALELIERAGLDAPEVVLLALSSAAWAESVAGDPAAVEALIESAGDAGGDRGLQAELHQARGMALIRAGDFAAAGDVCERAADRARVAARPDVAALCLLNAAAAAACAGDLERVLSLADRAAGWPWAGVSLELQMRAARAHALSRLGRHAEAVETAAANASRAEAAECGAADRALTRLDLGVVELAAGRADRGARSLAAALEASETGIPRALARLRLAEALVRAGDPVGALRELERVPFEPIGPADLPETLVPGISRVQGLIAAAVGDRERAERHLGQAEAAWRRVGASRPGGGFTEVIVDLGRPPVAGLVEPRRELATLEDDRRALAGGR